MNKQSQIDVEVTTYFLSMPRPAENVAPELPEGVTLTHLQSKTPEYCQFLFLRVGGPFKWFSRMGWNYQQWEEHLSSDLVQIFVASIGGAPIGYFELNFEDSRESAELKFIGLFPSAIGKGYGKWLLNAAIFNSFDSYSSCQRLWLHTCSEDHPAALQNYLKRGFSLEKEETEWDSIPNFDSPLWLGDKFTRAYLQKYVKSNEK